ncbi:uncharacterized protein bcl2l12 [Melanotaenia boesemani]|uniref:uncharacterized protein bcl2l12 n=1 Tax=Melanotaenia boesemani TaxID=1250792 RepID=UPI001C041C59|nr:uncharacterized protein bcl2l12 [Melanotaenia boesemani]
MSEPAGRSSSISSISSVYSVSLVEIKAETRLVLQAFLERTLSTPHKERPGKVGGAYDDHNKFRSKPHSQPNDGRDHQAEDENTKKTGLKGLIKQLPQRSTIRRTKDAKGSLDRDIKAKHYQEDGKPSSSSSSSDDDDREKWKKKQKKIKRKLSQFFKKMEKQKKEKEKERIQPLSSGDTSAPSYRPEFYNEVAEKLDRIARKSTKLKIPSPVVQPTPVVCDKEVVVQQLVELLSLEGDAINTKIQSDPILRNSLKRLSYGSFARVIDIFNSSQVPQVPPSAPPASPTLRRIAVSMEVSRRMVTASGTNRIQGFAEHYMNTFASWVKSHGGWESVAELEEPVEYD